MRTRLLAATLTATAALVLTACSGNDTPTGTSTAAAPPPATPTASATTTSTAPATTGAPGTDPAATGAPTDPAAPPATAKASPPADAGLPPAPDAATVARLVAALDAIDPDIVAGDPGQAADRARDQCQAISRFPKDRAKLVDLANQRFTSARHPAGFGPEQAARILDAVRTTVCAPTP